MTKFEWNILCDENLGKPLSNVAKNVWIRTFIYFNYNKMFKLLQNMFWTKRIFLEGSNFFILLFL